MSPKKLFISGALTEDGTADIKTQIKNMGLAIDAGIECMRKGHHVFIPHLSLLTHIRAQEKDFDVPWQTWMNTDQAFLDNCDGLVFISSSKGSEIEKQRALDLGLEVYYSLDDVPEVIAK